MLLPDPGEPVFEGHGQGPYGNHVAGRKGYYNVLVSLKKYLDGRDSSRVNFNVPAKGLFLERVQVSRALQLGE